MLLTQDWPAQMKTEHAMSRFQTFDDQSHRPHVAERVQALRAHMAALSLDGFLVPRADAYQGEYVAPADERLAWLTGFTGSAGFAIVLAREAALFIDGRYTIQAAEQTDTSLFTPVDFVATPPSRWLRDHVKPGMRIGYDAWHLTPGQVEQFEKALDGKDALLVAVEGNPIDALWSDRPAEPMAQATLYPARLAGTEAAAKIARIAAALDEDDALLLSDPHAVAWAFNIRGGDVAHTPLPHSRALVRRKGRPALYIAAQKLSNSVRDALEEIADVRAPGELAKDLSALGKTKAHLRFDAATVPAALVAGFRDAGGVASLSADPVALMKAAKSPAERRGSRAAHLRDGVAMTRFLAWFDREAPSGKLTEIDAARALESFRAETGRLKEISFPTISAFGAHAASPHYRVTEASNARIAKGIYLVDSGAQFEDGTTDITRTVCVGRPTAEMRDRFTRVLKGHIAIARAVFPKGTSGAQIDALARMALWEAGLDFDHGTGHGVGAYLSVHEGPQRISKLGTVPLEEGMILSNEPGYYKAGAYGIRIENLLVVEKRKIAGGDRDMLGFETLTFAPIARDLIDLRLLQPGEIAWLDAYHARVRKVLSPKLDAADKRWLRDATRRLR